MKNTCDVVILTMNHYKFTKLCLDSLHTFDAGFPMVLHVFDNGSTDGTPDNITRDFFGKVKVWRSDQNLGFAAGNNTVIDRTNGRFVCLLNNDTIVTPDWLGEMVEAMESDPRIGIAGCRGNNVGDNKDQTVNCAYTANIDNADYVEVCKHARRLAKAQPRFKTARDVVGFCMLLRRSMLNRIGLLDTRFWPGNFEDNDLCRRAVEAGYRIVVANRSFVYHFVSTTFRDNAAQWHTTFQVNKGKFDAKWEDTGRKARIGRRPRDRLRVAVELPSSPAAVGKVMDICDELRYRGIDIHTFGPPASVPLTDTGTPHVAAALPDKQIAGSRVVLHCGPPPATIGGVSRVHMVVGDDLEADAEKHHVLIIGSMDDDRFRPRMVKVQWRDRDDRQRKRGKTPPPDGSFHDMVDRIEKYLYDLQSSTPA